MKFDYTLYVDETGAWRPTTFDARSASDASRAESSAVTMTTGLVARRFVIAGSTTASTTIVSATTRKRFRIAASLTAVVLISVHPRARRSCVIR